MVRQCFSRSESFIALILTQIGLRKRVDGIRRDEMHSEILRRMDVDDLPLFCGEQILTKEHRHRNPTASCLNSGERDLQPVLVQQATGQMDRDELAAE